MIVCLFPLFQSATDTLHRLTTILPMTATIGGSPIEASPKGTVAVVEEATIEVEAEVALLLTSTGRTITSTTAICRLTITSRVTITSVRCRDRRRHRRPINVVIGPTATTGRRVSARKWTTKKFQRGPKSRSGIHLRWRTTTTVASASVASRAPSESRRRSIATLTCGGGPTVTKVDASDDQAANDPLETSIPMSRGCPMTDVTTIGRQEVAVGSRPRVTPSRHTIKTDRLATETETTATGWCQIATGKSVTQVVTRDG